MRLGDPRKYQGNRERVHWRFFYIWEREKEGSSIFPRPYLSHLEAPYLGRRVTPGDKKDPPFFVHHRTFQAAGKVKTHVCTCMYSSIR